MHFLLDNLTVAFIALIVVGLVVMMQLRSGEVAADRTALYATKKHTLEFADGLTRELNNIGAHMPAGERIGKLTFNGNGMTDTLQYWRVNSADDTLKIEYVLTLADSVTIGDSTVYQYQLQRYQDDVAAGGSPPSLSAFRIDLLDKDGDAVAGPGFDDTRQVRIRLANTLSFGDVNDRYIPQVYWGTTLRPNSLK